MARAAIGRLALFAVVAALGVALVWSVTLGLARLGAPGWAKMTAIGLVVAGVMLPAAFPLATACHHLFAAALGRVWPWPKRMIVSRQGVRTAGLLDGGSGSRSHWARDSRVRVWREAGHVWVEATGWQKVFSDFAAEPNAVSVRTEGDARSARRLRKTLRRIVALKTDGPVVAPIIDRVTHCPKCGYALVDAERRVVVADADRCPECGWRRGPGELVLYGTSVSGRVAWFRQALESPALVGGLSAALVVPAILYLRQVLTGMGLPWGMVHPIVLGAIIGGVLGGGIYVLVRARSDPDERPARRRAGLEPEGPDQLRIAPAGIAVRGQFGDPTWRSWSDVGRVRVVRWRGRWRIMADGLGWRRWLPRPIDLAIDLDDAEGRELRRRLWHGGLARRFDPDATAAGW